MALLNLKFLGKSTVIRVTLESLVNSAVLHIMKKKSRKTNLFHTGNSQIFQIFFNEPKHAKYGYTCRKMYFKLFSVDQTSIFMKILKVYELQNPLIFRF